MANNQMPSPEGDQDIISQAEAYTMAGISRAVLRGCMDRGELRIADNLGSRGSARLFRSDVARLMAERRWPGQAAGGQEAEASADGKQCGGCLVLRAEVRTLQESQGRDRETIRRLRDALAAATA
ncbi:hypothetical protein AB0N12_06370 [Streptomyces albogriseolus]|uniref:hypothetical protein n=1 Tax=Streptomyces albogriseolus TaxID=1887 RepID=UPI00346064E3